MYSLISKVSRFIELLKLTPDFVKYGLHKLTVVNNIKYMSFSTSFLTENLPTLGFNFSVKVPVLLLCQ